MNIWKIKSAIAVSMFLFPLASLERPALAGSRDNASATILPAGCSVSHDVHVKCVVTQQHMASGAGINWGPWYSIEATAPNGYKLEWAEAHVKGQYDHVCGVRDEGTGNPSPVSADAPPVGGHRAGTAHWAQCFIAARDAAHVVVTYSIQGTEGKNVVYFGHGGTIASTGKEPPGTIFADTELIVVCVKSN
jgi:hypothetical protein